MHTLYYFAYETPGYRKGLVYGPDKDQVFAERLELALYGHLVSGVFEVMSKTLVIPTSKRLPVGKCGKLRNKKPPSGYVVQETHDGGWLVRKENS